MYLYFYIDKDDNKVWFTYYIIYYQIKLAYYIVVTTCTGIRQDAEELKQI